MSTGWIELPITGVPAYPSAINFPVSSFLGALSVAIDTSALYEFNGTNWIPIATPGAAIALDAIVGDVVATGPGVATATIQPNVVTNSKLAQMPPDTIKGNNTGSTANAMDLTVSQVNTLLGGVTTLAPVGAIPNTDGGTIVGNTLTLQPANTSFPGVLTAADWNTFNNKQDATRSNYITNPSAEVDTSDWNLYNNTGRTVPAFLINQDLTYTSAVSGGGGNGVEIEYIYNASFPSSTPNINVISSTHVQVQWNNGPTIANNPTATQLKAAWDAVPAALAVATVAISGTASKAQYITGAEFLSGGGDQSPINGTGGVVAGVTFTRTTVNPIVGVASFDLGKDAANREGEGVSTDFVIDNLDKGELLQISFSYDASSGMVLGSNSDVRVFIYDITNAILLPVTPLDTIAGPVSTIKTFTGIFTTSNNSIDYRLILHIATSSAVAWDLILDDFVVGDEINPTQATQVPSLVLLEQPISGSVTDHMCVMWRDGATQWIPATIAGAAIPAFGDDQTQLGFATNIIGSTASVFIRGAMNGFSFGPFTGFEQYIDNTAGMISPLPSPFTDLYVIVGMAISSTVLNIQFSPHVDLISNASGTPLKGGLLSNSAVNDGTGDQVLSVGTNGNALIANTGSTLGIEWAPAIVNGGGFTYTVATRTLVGALSGDVTGALTATAISAATVTGKAITGFVSGAGTVTATDTVLTAIEKLNGNIALKQSTTLTDNHILVGNASNIAADVAMSGDVTIVASGATSITAATVNGKLITGYVSGAGTVAATDTILQAIQKLNGNDILKAPSASPTFTGDVNSSTGNVLISTIGKGLQVKTGTNAKIGTAVLAAGTVTVANNSVTANSRIFLTSNTDGGTPGWLRVSAKTVGTSFVITSSSATDTSTVAWTIIESIP